ncbi:MAG: hypothetical protein IJW71_05670 [Clostridia bacterium]|nr:hypothetical protein [Clostridia bacterium]
MTEEWLELRREFEEDGSVLAVFSCRLPQPTGGKGEKRIATLYRRLAKEWERYTERILLARARAADGPSAPRRRHNRHSTLEITADVVYKDDEILSVLRRVLIKGGGARRLLCFGETFRIRDGLLLPLSAFAEKPRGCRGLRGFVFHGGSVTLFHRGGRAELPLKNKKEQA